MTSLVPPLTRSEKYEKLAFTYCKLGTAGLISWVLTPPIMVLAVSIAAIALYARAVTLGVSESRCFLKRPPLIIATWGVIAALDAVWLFVLR